jgi:fermentation-respiration switch protein FrsA (DUF1100 family)
MYLLRMNRTSMNSILSLLLILGTLYLLLMVFVFFTQSSMLYFPELPSRKITTTPDRYDLRYEDVELITEDGLRLHGWFLPAQNPRATLLFFHGNAGNISHRMESLEIFHNLGMEVLIFDYRGYGQSEGQPSEKGIYLDAEAAWRYLTETREIPPRRILLFGRSLGAAIASNLARDRRPMGLIMESAFTSATDLAASLYPFLPVRLLSRFHYDNRDNLQAVTAPVLVAHSREDEIIPYAHGRQLFSAAAEPKAFLEMRGGHNDGFLVSGQTYIEGLDNFIARCTSTSHNRTK